MATIADVAKQAGVGLGTVSRVLNGSPQVRASTRARVLDAIDTLGYVPNPLARGLSRGRCQTLGVLVPFFTHASAVERLRGVVAALDESRYDLVLFNIESPLHRDQHLASITGRDRADGLLVMSLPIPPRDLDRLTTAGVPVVLVDARGKGVAAVVTDDVAGGRMATEHLLALGHRSVAFIGDDPHSSLGFTSSAQREHGYAVALAEAGIPHRAELVRHAAHERGAAEQVAAELLDEPGPPTAVFASSDVQAFGVLAAAAARGLRVPEDLSVIGFDDIELATFVGLTTVHQQLFESGHLGARLLLEAVSGSVPAPVEHRLPLSIVERTTTGALRGAA
ncbi:MAG: LacI family DNA-binding transcriptional regulator [Acidimicrobiales bacterium]